MQDTTTTTTTTTLEIPNAQLYWSQDVYGNHIQALVPFGVHAEPVFEALHADWDGAKPVLVAIVHASSIRALLADAEACKGVLQLRKEDASSIRALLADAEAYAVSRVHPDKDFDPTPY